MEKQVVKDLREQGFDVSEQITIVPKNGLGNKKGNRTRADAIIKDKDGTTTQIEAKRSASTKLSSGQIKAKRHIKDGNKKFEVRSDKDGYYKNKEIQIDYWNRKDKYNK